MFASSHFSFRRYSRKDLILSALVCLGSLVFTPASSAKEHTYSGDQFPDKSETAWAAREAKGRSLHEGSLMTKVEAGERSFYALGFLEDGRPMGAAHQAWNKDVKDFTIEFKVSGSADSPENEFFRVTAAGGDKRGWTVMFYPNMIRTLRTSEPVQVDTSVPDTYIMSVKDGVMTFSSENRGVLFRGIKSSPMKSSIIYFGSMTRDNIGGGSMQWALDYLKWGGGDVEAAAKTSAE